MVTSARDMVGVCVGESVCVCVRYDGPMPLCICLCATRQLRTMLPGSSCHVESERLKLTVRVPAYVYVCVSIIYAA